MKKIYIVGKITDDPGYRAKFARAEKSLTLQGHVVLNPAWMPEGFEYEDYMTVCFAMITVCDALYMLPDWKDSPGARREYDFAIEHAKEIMYAPESTR